MNILVFSWRDPKHPLAGGAEQVMHEHMKGWIEAGHKVTLFSSKIKSLSRTENFDGVSIVRKGYQYLGVQIAGFYYYLKNKMKYDLIVDQFHGVPFFTPLYVNKPILAVIQEPARDVWFKNLLPFPINLIIGILGFIFEPFFFLLYKKIKFMTGSVSAKENVSQYGISKKNITVISHGVIIPGDLVIENNRRTAITFLGTLSSDKGIEDALKCFKILSKYNKFKFWVIGKAETKKYLSKLETLVIKFGIENKVKFWGRVDDNRKFELLSKSLVFINPSVHEGWGLVNIEANFVGTPVIAYNSAGLTDSVKSEYSGIIVSENTPENLAAEINNLLLDANRYKRLQKTSLLWSRKFDWKSSKLQSLQIINELYEIK